jgi:hypothetical protein
MGYLISLLVFVVFLCIVFWLVNMFLGSIPNKPPFLQPAIIAIIAIIALIWLFGGWAPWMHEGFGGGWGHEGYRR